MKTLIAFYSRTGNTKKVGNEIAKVLKADVDEIIDKTDRSGIRGWLGGGRDALFKRPTEITTKKNPQNYELVVIGTPIWVGTMVPSIRTYLSKFKFNKIAFFCTFGGSEGKCFKDMESLTKKPLAVFGIKDKNMGKDLNRIKEFCNKLK